MTRFFTFLFLIFTIIIILPVIACAQPANTTSPSTSPVDTTRPPETEVPRLKVGDIAPQFTLGDLDNKPVSLSDFNGKKVIINMWLIGCHGCEEELPFLQEFYEKMNGQGVILIGINTSNGIALVRSYVSHDKLSYPMLVDTGKRLDPSYSITGFPTTYFIDEKGVIRAIKDGAFESESDIEETYNSY